MHAQSVRKPRAVSRCGTGPARVTAAMVHPPSTAEGGPGALGARLCPAVGLAPCGHRGCRFPPCALPHRLHAAFQVDENVARELVCHRMLRHNNIVLFKEARPLWPSKWALQATPTCCTALTRTPCFEPPPAGVDALTPGHRHGVRLWCVAATTVGNQRAFLTPQGRRRVVRPHLQQGPLLRGRGAVLLQAAHRRGGVHPLSIGGPPRPEGAPMGQGGGQRHRGSPADTRVYHFVPSWRMRCWTGATRRC